MSRLRVVLLVFLAVLPGVFSLAHLRLNRSGSLPLGLYREDRSLPITYGTHVSACLPGVLARFARSRGYLPSGEGCPEGVAPVLKRVVALPGDRVWVSEAGLVVEGVPIARTARWAEDSLGRPIPRLPAGLYRVASGEVWVVGTALPNSWDSRYYGPLPVASLRAARPVWTF